MRATFEDQPLQAWALTGLAILAAVILAAAVARAQRGVADDNLAGRAVADLREAWHVTARDEVDPTAYALAVGRLSKRVSFYLTSDSARRDPRMAAWLDRARLAYLAAYWIWLTEDPTTPSRVWKGDVRRALTEFPELKATAAVSGAGVSFPDPDTALEVLWRIGATETRAAAAGLRKRGYRTWTGSTASGSPAAPQ